MSIRIRLLSPLHTIISAFKRKKHFQHAYVAAFSLCFFLVCGTAKGQNGWVEVSSNVVNGYTSSLVEVIAMDQNGNIYAGLGSGVYKWDGRGWTQLGEGDKALNANFGILSLAADNAGNIYAAGYFENASGGAYVAKWNGTNWTELGGTNSLSVNGSIQALVTDASGNVYAAGEFTNGYGRNYVAKWDGTSWTELGGTNSLKANGTIWTLTIDAAGNIYAGGNFKNSSGHNYVAKWDGNTWSELGSSTLNANGAILCLTMDAAGHLYAGGMFYKNGGYYVAQWNGTAWAELGTAASVLDADGWIQSIAADPFGNIYAAGGFTNGTTGPYVAKWDGTSWAELGSGASQLNANASIKSILTDPNGNVYATGHFTDINGNKYVAWWDETTAVWQQLGTNGIGKLRAGGPIYTLTSDSKENIYAAGSFINNSYKRYVAKWDGLIWSEVGSSTSALQADGDINCIVADSSGNLYAAGDFRNSARYYYVAKWDGNSWTELGSGPSALNANDRIVRICMDAAGNVYAAGSFTNASGKYYVAKWDGNSWSEVGTGTNALFTTKPIAALAVDSAGNVYTVAYFYAHGDSRYNIMKWNGTTWSELRGENTSLFSEDPVHQLVLDAAGNVYSSSHEIFINYGQTHVIKKWDGTKWQPVGSYYFFDWIYDLHMNTKGELFAAGSGRYSPAQHTVFKWNGKEWAEVGRTSNILYAKSGIYALHTDATGNIYAAGAFTNGTTGSYVARYGIHELAVPDIAGVNNQCLDSSTPATATGKITNPPDNGTLTITQDGNTLSYNTADSSFTYFTKGVTTNGNHTIRIAFSNAVNTTQKDSVYTVSPVLIPAISIAGTTDISSGQSATINITISNGGTDPVYQWQDSTSVHSWADIPGASSPSLTYTPQPGAKVRCKMTSNAACATDPIAVSNVLAFSITTAISPVQWDQYGLRLYPNPVKDIIFIDGLRVEDKWCALQVVGTDGTIVKKQTNVKGKKNVTVEASGLPKGIYTLLLKKENGVFIATRFIK